MAEVAEETGTDVADEPQEDTVEEAVAEVAVESPSRTITVNGTELEIPGKQPAEILFAARSVSRANRTGDEGAAVEAMVDMAYAYVGEDTLRDLMSGLNLEEGMALVEDILGKAAESYGTDTGKS